MVFLYILGALIVVLISICIAKEFESIAEDKGYLDRKYFWYCLLLGVIGYLMVIALPDRGISYQKTPIVPSAPSVSQSHSTIQPGALTNALEKFYK